MKKSKITIHTPSNHNFHVTFELPENAPKLGISADPIQVIAEVSGKECVIEIHDSQLWDFGDITLSEFTLKANLGLTSEEVIKNIQLKFGKNIKQVAIILYKFIEEA